MRQDYEEILSRNEKLSWILPENHWAAMEKVNSTTVSALNANHLEQMRQNIKSGLWKKHGPMSLGIHSLGANKAVIGIGAGRSLERNWNTLKCIYELNTLRLLDDQPFILVSCNHQFRPLLADGIHPHFVCLVDGSDVVFDQLNKSIPKSAQNIILLTGLHANPKVLTEWDRQGRQILFYVGASDVAKEVFKKETNEDPEPFCCEEGGNVLNTVWLWGMKIMKSTVHMCVGNDLSYPLEADLGGRRKSYYADGDYSSNLANKRDEAKYNFAWMGFEYDWSPIIQQWTVNLKPRGTSWQLWTYKRWIESQIAMHEADAKSWHYYNCSEAGILGVLAKDDKSKEALERRDNWTLMDAAIPRRFHTRRLEDAATQFIAAREMLWQETHTGTRTGAGPVIHLPGKTDIANGTESPLVWTPR